MLRNPAPWLTAAIYQIQYQLPGVQIRNLRQSQLLSRPVTVQPVQQRR